jgi:hypothetical protein
MSIQPRTTETVSARIGYVVGVDDEYCAHVYYPAADTVKAYDVGPDYEVGDHIDNGRPGIK